MWACLSVNPLQRHHLMRTEHTSKQRAPPRSVHASFKPFLPARHLPPICRSPQLPPAGPWAGGRHTEVGALPLCDLAKLPAADSRLGSVRERTASPTVICLLGEVGCHVTLLQTEQSVGTMQRHALESDSLAVEM